MEMSLEIKKYVELQERSQESKVGHPQRNHKEHLVTLTLFEEFENK